MRIRTAPGLVILLVLTIVNSLPSAGQSVTSSALTGTVSDATGAVIPGAHVTATDVDSGAIRTTRSGSEGRYLFAQVNPGRYRITVEAAGFGLAQSEPTTAAVGETIAVNFKLSPAAGTQTVKVNAQIGLLSLENPNTSTTLEAKTIERLPNPGQDLTYLAQFAQGALMNTAGSSNDAKAPGGYGNVEFNGLPATSNGYILDGYDTNDPWLGLNIGLSTNLVIGLDAVQEATVNTNSFSVDQGRYGASQVNYFTKSGTNVFHGDAYEIWNGSLFNAEDYFLHANDTSDSIAKRPRSTVNEFGVSVGGPIRRDRLFFFAHYEGIRIALPLVSQITLPTPAYQQYVLSQLAVGRDGPRHGHGPSRAARREFRSTSRCSRCCRPRCVFCPLVPRACWLPKRQSVNGDGCASQRQASLNNSDNEDLIVVKIDHTIDANNSVWYRFQQDTGPAGCVHRPGESHIQFLFSAAAAHSRRWAIPTSSARGSSTSSIPGQLVFEHLRAEQLSTGAATFPIVLRRGAKRALSRRSAATTIPIRRDARSPSGRSTTT